MSSMPVYVLGEALMDCIVQPDGQLKPLMGGSPYNMARAAALRGAQVSFLNPFSTDTFGVALRAQLQNDGVKTVGAQSPCPTSLAVVNIREGGQPAYGFYREGIADRDYSAADMLDWLAQQPLGVLHTGSLLLIPPEDRKTLQVLQGAKALGFTISVDVNLRTMVARDLSTYVSGVREIAAVADWLKASDEDLLDLKLVSDEPALAQADALAAPWLAQGVSRLALTFGSQGAALYVDGACAQACAPVVSVVDTVGAGDTFWGNCLADWVLQPQGAAARVQATLQLAMKAAAINCTRRGCQPPTAAELFA